MSELKAGGLKAAGTPWQNATITYTVEKNQPALRITAQSVDIKDADLSLTHQNDQTFGDILFKNPEDSDVFIQKYTTPHLNLQATIDGVHFTYTPK